MTTPIRQNLEKINNLLHALSEEPCIAEAHGPSNVCAPCKAREILSKRAAKPILPGTGSGIVLDDNRIDSWLPSGR